MHAKRASEGCGGEVGLNERCTSRICKVSYPQSSLRAVGGKRARARGVATRQRDQTANASLQENGTGDITFRDCSISI